jgi:hypothetical protein
MQAIDASKWRRPGVPQKRTPHPAGAPHWTQPAMQPLAPGVIKDAQKPWTATFGLGPTPKGLSGAMRRFAYEIPDYRIRRWALLLLADRVDALEWRLTQPGTWAKMGLTVAVAALAVGAARRLRRRSNHPEVAAHAALSFPRADPHR